MPTPRQSFRLDPELMRAVRAKAVERGTNATEIVRRALERYVKTK